MKLNRNKLRKMILKEMAGMQAAAGPSFSYKIEVEGREFEATTVYLEMKVGQEDCDVAFQAPLHVTDQDLAHILEGGLGEELEYSYHIDSTETSANANEFLAKYKSLIAPHIQNIVYELLNLDLEEPDHLGYY